MDKSLRPRLPPISAALVIEMTLLEASRDENGVTWCIANGIGAVRTRLGAIPDRRMFSRNSSKHAIERSRDGARVLLGAMCQACPHDCHMKHWGFTTSSPASAVEARVRRARKSTSESP